MTDSTPAVPTTSTDSRVSVQSATPQYVLLDSASVSIDVMFDLVFEDIGGQEIINIARNDTVFTENLIYQPIKNSVLLTQQYNPNSLLSVQGVAGDYFKNFPISFSSKIPEVGTGDNGEIIYFDSEGNLVVNVINLDSDEQVEISILSAGEVFNDTI
jgi:hypothetical protein